MTTQQPENWDSPGPWGQQPPPAPPQPGQWPGQPGGGYQYYPPPKIDNYMVWSVLATLFCFLPTGIAAIVYSSQVNSKLAAGDVAGATKAANNAKTWIIVSAVAGVVVWLLVVMASGESTY